MEGENENENASKPVFGKMGVDNDSTSTVFMFLIFTLLIGSVLGITDYAIPENLRTVLIKRDSDMATVILRPCVLGRRRRPHETYL